MLLGRVIGTVVASRKEERLDGLKLLVVRQMDVDASDTASYVVAVDAVGAGVDEVVLYCTGSSARQTTQTHERPCDAVVMAIVDQWEVGGKEIWTKSISAAPTRGKSNSRSKGRKA